MNLKEAKETTVFVINNGKINEENLYDKMRESLDETTTPNGVGSRVFIEKETLTIDPDDYEDQEDLDSAFSFEIGLEKTKKEDFQLLPNGNYELEYFVISTWGCTGNNYSSGKNDWSRMFLKEEDAEEKMFEYLKADFDNDFDNSSNCYYSEDDAIETLAENLNVDVNVMKHILRKQEIVENIKEERKYLARQKYEKQKKERTEKWMNKFGISKTGSDYENAEVWFEKNKKEITEFIERGGNKLGEMSGKNSKKIAWAICNDTRFDAEGINIVSLSHVLRK